MYMCLRQDRSTGFACFRVTIAASLAGRIDLASQHWQHVVNYGSTAHALLDNVYPHTPQIKSKTEKKKDKFFTMDPQQITFDMVRQKLKDIVMTRGKRGVDRNEQVEMLTYLASVAKGPVQKIEVLIQVVSALFDINPSMSTHMSVPLWKRCAGTLLEVLQTLADNDYIEVDEAYDNPEERTEEPPAGQPAKVCILYSVSERKE